MNINKKEDQNLIKSFKQGEIDKLGELYEKYFDGIYRFIYFRVYHKETAEDLTAQVFTKTIEKLNDFNHKKGNFSAWLYCVARNKVIDYYRTRKNNVDISNIFDLESGDNSACETELKEKLEQARYYLSKLDGIQKEIVIMRIWDELSYKEIAEIIGRTESNCKMIFSRTVNKLKSEAGGVLALFIILNEIKNLL